MYKKAKRLGMELLELIGGRMFKLLSSAETEKKYFERVGESKDNGAPVEDFFVEAFKNRSKIHMPILFGFLAILLLDIWTKGLFNADYVTIGLGLDILGAYFVATGLIRGKSGIKDATKSHAAVLGGKMSPESMTAASDETVDALYGVTFLTIGFSIQIIGNLVL